MGFATRTYKTDRFWRYKVRLLQAGGPCTLQFGIESHKQGVR